MNAAEKREIVYKWRKENPERYREIQKRATATYRDKNREKMKANQLNYYYKHREEILKRIKEKRERDKNNG